MRKSAVAPLALSLALALVTLAHLSFAQAQVPASDPDPKMVTLGKAIFFDTNLSVNGKQSCASCHDPATGFTGPDSETNVATAVYEGAIATRYGNRKPPTSAYAGDSPILHFDAAKGQWLGGLFCDGRATGESLGDPLAEQAQGPFLNPLEQAIPDARLVAVKVADSSYADLFREVWGQDSLDFARDVDGVYERIARSVAAYERSAEVNPYTSKFDLFWDNAVASGKDVTKIKFPEGSDPMGGGGGSGGGGMGGGGTGGGGMGGGGMGGGGMGGGSTDPYRWQNYRGLGFTDQELMGLAAFNDPSRANCASCHSLAPGSAGRPLFTDFSYHNLGVPKNPDNPFYSMPRKWNPDGEGWVDLGLGGFLRSAGYASDVYDPEVGKVRVPTVRNVDLRPSAEFVKAYAHNGYFESLEDIVLFYAWRGLRMNGGLGLGGSGRDCDMMGGGGMGGGGMGGGMDPARMCNPNLFPQPEVNHNLTPMNHFNMMDQRNLVIFLETLSDGYFER